MKTQKVILHLPEAEVTVRVPAATIEFDTSNSGLTTNVYNAIQNKYEREFLKMGMVKLIDKLCSKQVTIERKDDSYTMDIPFDRNVPEEINDQKLSIGRWGWPSITIRLRERLLDFINPNKRTVVKSPFYKGTKFPSASTKIGRILLEIYEKLVEHKKDHWHATRDLYDCYEKELFDNGFLFAVTTNSSISDLCCYGSGAVPSIATNNNVNMEYEFRFTDKANKILADMYAKRKERRLIREEEERVSKKDF